MLNVIAVVTSILAGALPPPDCNQLRSAYQNLLSSSFTMERHLTVFVDGEQQARETAKIEYANGKVTRTVQKQEFADNKKMELEMQGDPALKLDFDCRSFQALPNDRYRYRSHNDKGDEEIVFALDARRSALVPLSWSASQTAKFLFIKKSVKMVGENTSFEWR